MDETKSGEAQPLAEAQAQEIAALKAKLAEDRTMNRAYEERLRGELHEAKATARAAISDADLRKATNRHLLHIAHDAALRADNEFTDLDDRAKLVSLTAQALVAMSL
jgi:hypothetical protein